MTTRVLILPMLVVLLGAAGAHAQSQQADEAAKEKAAEEAARDSIAKMAAEQAAAIAKAQLKVAEEEARREAAAITPVDVEVVISRYRDDKKTGSLPYVLTVNAGEHMPETRLRMGASVPVPTMTTPIVDGKPVAVPGPTPFNYQDVSTQIDVKARPLGDGRFELFVSVAERALAMPQDGSPALSTVPVIRTFQSSNSIVLRDGQTRQFTAASDRITGEVVRVDVTLRVAK